MCSQIQSQNEDEHEDTRRDAEDPEESESRVTPPVSLYRESGVEKPATAQQVEEVEEPVLRRQIRAQRNSSKPIYPTPYTSGEFSTQASSFAHT